MTTWTVPRSYQTPASRYPLSSEGRVQIHRRRYKSGFYYMHGVREYQYYELTHPWRCTSLEIDGQTWMVDDPLHWEATQELAATFPMGRALIGGLGLGLIVHALQAYAHVDEIIVVERDLDVIKTIQPLLPHDPRLHIIHDDFWAQLARYAPTELQTIFVDLWVGQGLDLWYHEVNEAWDLVESVYGLTAQVIFFGFQAKIEMIRACRTAWNNVPQSLKDQLMAGSLPTPVSA